MLTVTYGQLRDPNFARGMMKVANCNDYKSPALVINIAKINQRFLEEAKLAEEAYQKLVRLHAKKNAIGELEPHEGKPGTFFVPKEVEAAWDAGVKEFHAISFEVARPRIPLADVMTAAKLTPMEVGALEPILQLPLAEAKE